MTGDAEFAKMIGQYMARPQRSSYCLTWAGHEFLDAACDNIIRNSAKGKVMGTTSGLAFEFLRAVLMHKRKELLGLE